jgi:DNA-binding XRE family transcriptional regulator
MPNIGALLKQEITRLARREVRAQVQATKKASTQYRRHIAALRRQVATLERQVALVRRQPASAAATALREPTQKIRFVAKGLKSQRARLGLSAADFGRLVGVSAQSIYNWEQGHATPRAGQLAVLAARRGIGKREALQMLAEQAGSQSGAKKSGAKKSGAKKSGAKKSGAKKTGAAKQKR